MTSQTLREARKYEEMMEVHIAPEDRPVFHLSPRVGWMNDPNGFSYYKGEYHLFYQYHPYDSFWGPMHWGHAVSKDLLHWVYLPAALAPDMPYDKDGCFYGSAITLPDASQMLLYTGVMREPQADGSFRDVQAQCIAIGDGRDYEKVLDNPVLTEKDMPEGSSKYDFRDPKVWQDEDGMYYCVVGNCTEDHDGQILLYSSADGIHWKYEKILVKNNGRFGRMWECPDFFELDGKYMVLTSPQDMLPEGFEYHNGNGTLCLMGSFDRDTKTFMEERDQTVDYGIDFYAPQTILTPDGRRVMIGWMQNWDTCNMRSQPKSWFGQMSLPRELSFRNGRLYQKPVRELDELRCNKVEYKDVFVNGLVRLDGIEGRLVDMELLIRPADTAQIFRKFALRFAQDKTHYTAISFRPMESILKVDRKFSGSRRAIIHQRRSLVNHEEGKLKLRVILDRLSVEVFINDGEQVMTATIDTPQDAREISFFAEDGNVIVDVVKYDISGGR
ncbi:MAG: glycoside hydrolase family 32 protein [Lachnospiraceae bacterium]|nr:glycoside hydrolase family 32 protein [Lachnospiraceae bacterium]